MFFKCLEIRRLWLHVEEIYKQIIVENIRFSCQDIVLGYKMSENTKQYTVVNKLIMYCKYHIWERRQHSLVLHHYKEGVSLVHILDTFKTENFYLAYPPSACS